MSEQKRYEHVDAYVPYGLCMGYVSDKFPEKNTPSHKYYDGEWHMKNSHGLCPDCAKLYHEERRTQ